MFQNSENFGGVGVTDLKKHPKIDRNADTQKRFDWVHADVIYPDIRRQ